MSVKVLSEALDHSVSTGTDRCVLLALADAASHDGVTWLPILPARARGADPHHRVDERRCITHRAACSKRQALRSIGALAGLGELEVRQAQRGQKRINVYRVTVGSIGDSEVDYDRLPFALDEPFGTGLRGDNLAPRAAGFDVAEPAPREVPETPVPGDRLAPHGVPDPRARVNKGVEPSEDPSAATGAAAALDDDLARLGIGARLRLRALADPLRARAWCELAAAEADTNPAGFFRAGFDSGEWPSPRVVAGETPVQSRRRWIEVTSWQLDREDAHAIVDGWADLDHVERSILHGLVDTVRDQHEAQAADATDAAEPEAA